MFEIDSVRLFINPREIDFSTIEHLVSVTNPKIKDNMYQGYYGNFFLKYSIERGVYLYGSISNFFCGYENTLETKDLKAAFSKLGNELQIDIHNARLFRVDLALNLKMNENAAHYDHTLFAELSKFKRFEKAKSLIFETYAEAFCIYDKTAELLEKRNIATTNNILRLEYRIQKNISKILKKDFKVENLYDIEILQKILYMFDKRYSSIIKNGKTPNKNDIISIDYLAIKGIETIGPDIVLECIDKMFKDDTSQPAKLKAIKKSRLKKKIRQLIMKSCQANNILLNELDKKVFDSIDLFKKSLGALDFSKKITQ